MIEKLIFPDDDDALVKMAGGQVWTLLSAPGENIKSAASDVFSKEALSSLVPDKDHFAIHLVAMGDQETYGHNKNGDGFPKEALVKYHDTFVKNGHFFREHKNRNADTQGIGIVKASAYNDKMRRVEIVVHGHIKKAEEEFEMARDGKPLSFSMSCRVPYDICSICNNKAKSASAYCDHLKRNMGRYMDGHEKYAFAINDKPTFFDISRVKNPADRIAHFISYKFGEGDMAKAASFDAPISGEDWARFYGVDLSPELPLLDSSRLAILEKLAAEEEWVSHLPEDNSPKTLFYKQAKEAGFEGQLTEEELDTFRKESPGNLFHKLAKRGCLLPFESFCSYITGMSIEEATHDSQVKAACALLPDIFKSITSGAFPKELEDMFEPSGCCGGSCGCEGGKDDDVQKFMDSVAERFSCRTEPAKSRIIRITIKAGSSVLEGKKPTKIDTYTDHGWSADILAGAYGMYKLSTFKAMKSMGQDLDDSQFLLALVQNNLTI